MNIQGQDMKTYLFFVVPIGNAKITEIIKSRPRAPVLKYYQESYNSCCLSSVASVFTSIDENKSATSLADHIE